MNEHDEQAGHDPCRRRGRGDRGRGDRGRDDRGEGVVSLSIAILIVAGLAALMWVGLREIWFEAESTTRDRVAEIGQ